MVCGRARERSALTECGLSGEEAQVRPEKMARAMGGWM